MCDKAVSNAIANYTRQIQYLSDEERLELFCFHADLPDNKLSKDLECLRTQILEKCTKLPTAVEEIATSMAEVTRTPTHWKEALRRLDKAAIINKHVTPTLRSSYNALPYNLQACFLYFASFPSDTAINSEYLVYAWLASFRELVSGGAQAVDVAWIFIEQLVDRCAIQASRVSGDGRVKSCLMQEFFHILALSESEKEAKCFLKHGEALNEFQEFPFIECKDARRVSLINTVSSQNYQYILKSVLTYLCLNCQTP
jgi:disease resistance protein RPM1